MKNIEERIKKIKLSIINKKISGNNDLKYKNEINELKKLYEELKLT